MLTRAVNENPMSISFGVERNSRMNRGDLADLSAFVAVADHLSFRAAASQLGVTPSALSHSMRQLEERLGVRLLDAQRIGDRCWLALARAAAAGNQLDRLGVRNVINRRPGCAIVQLWLFATLLP